jgi:hypothetical protein
MAYLTFLKASTLLAHLPSQSNFLWSLHQPWEAIIAPDLHKADIVKLLKNIRIKIYSYAP